MWKDVKPVPSTRAALIKRYADLEISGELKADHFRIEYERSAGDWKEITNPNWWDGVNYRIVEGKNHPSKRHDAIKAEWGAVKDKGTHERWVRVNSSPWQKVVQNEFKWFPEYDYEIRPINKPKLNLIDKTQLPIGTMTNYGRLMILDEEHTCKCFSDENGTSFTSFSQLRIQPMTEWLSWKGGNCPVPVGLIVDILLRNKQSAKGEPDAFDWEHDEVSSQDIIAYRIIGIAQGWTDNPTLVG